MRSSIPKYTPIVRSASATSSSSLPSSDGGDSPIPAPDAQANALIDTTTNEGPLTGDDAELMAPTALVKSESAGQPAGEEERVVFPPKEPELLVSFHMMPSPQSIASSVADNESIRSDLPLMHKPLFRGDKDTAKLSKKEIERRRRETERERYKLAQEKNRERARAVLRKSVRFHPGFSGSFFLGNGDW